MNTTHIVNGTLTHSTFVRDNVIGFSFSMAVHVVAFVLVTVVFLGNRSYIIFVPGTCVTGGDRKKADELRARSILNWMLFLSIVYMALRAVTTAIDIAGTMHAKGGLRYIGRVSTACNIMLNQMLIVIISMLIGLWMKVAFLWFDDDNTPARLVRILLAVFISVVNVLCAMSMVSAAIIYIIGPEAGAKVFMGGYYSNGVWGYTVSLILVAVLGFVFGVYITIQMYVSAKKASGAGGSWRTNTIVRNRIVSMVKISVIMVFMFVGVNTRIIGLIMVFVGAPRYLLALANRSIPDFLFMLSLVLLFQPFRLGRWVRPLTNIRKINLSPNGGRIAPGISEDEVTQQADAQPKEVGAAAEDEWHDIELNAEPKPQPEVNE
jgi:hypothetical protein